MKLMSAALVVAVDSLTAKQNRNKLHWANWPPHFGGAWTNQANAKVMADPRVKEMCDPANQPFDLKRMAYGGFTVLVDA